MVFVHIRSYLSTCMHMQLMQHIYVILIIRQLHCDVCIGYFEATRGYGIYSRGAQRRGE
jgi:hypothetical protein